MIERFQCKTTGAGLFEITDRVQDVVCESGICTGLCTILIQHTSASLTIQENADPSAKHDLQAWLDQLVKPNDPLYTHTSEGPDDMPAHIKAALTSTTLSIPFQQSRLCLGIWQGIYVWEHRYNGGNRKIVVHLGR